MRETRKRIKSKPGHITCTTCFGHVDLHRPSTRMTLDFEPIVLPKLKKQTISKSLRTIYLTNIDRECVETFGRNFIVAYNVAFEIIVFVFESACKPPSP